MPRGRCTRRVICTLLAAVAALTPSGCGGAQRSLLPDDLTFLRVGVDPRAMIDEATERLASLGLDERARFDSDRFSAAAYANSAGRTAIRVATVRGTVLALDAESEDGVLFALDPRTGTDLTRDRAPDIVIERTEAHRRCLAIATIDADAAFRPIPTAPRWLEPRLCVSALVDLDHDGRVEGVVEVPFDELGDPAPTISVPLTLGEGHFTPDVWPPTFAIDEIARREAALESAIERGEAARATRLAIELALIAALRGGSDAEIEAALGRVAPASQASTSLLDAARDRARSLRDAVEEATRPPPRGAGASDQPLDAASEASGEASVSAND